MVQGWALQYIMAYMPSGGAHTFEVKGGGGGHIPEGLPGLKVDKMYESG